MRYTRCTEQPQNCTSERKERQRERECGGIAERENIALLITVIQYGEKHWIYFHRERVPVLRPLTAQTHVTARATGHSIQIHTHTYDGFSATGGQSPVDTLPFTVRTVTGWSLVVVPQEFTTRKAVSHCNRTYVTRLLRLSHYLGIMCLLTFIKGKTDRINIFTEQITKHS